MKKTLGMLLLAAAIVMSAGACGEGTTDDSTEKLETVELAGWQEYTILRPDLGSEGEVDAAVALKDAFAALGAKLTLTTDWVKRGEEPPVGTKEILVGATNRPESDVGELPGKDYVIAFVNDRVVINGGSGEAVIEAVNWFIENCIGDTVSVPVTEYRYLAEYPLADVTIAGKALRDYAVVYDLTDSAADEAGKALAAQLYDGTGFKIAVNPMKSDEPKIRFEKDESLGIFDASCKMDGSDVVLSVNLLGMNKASELFLALLDAAEGDLASINEVKQYEVDNFAVADAAKMKKWRDQTDARIKEILNTPNMEIPEKKTVYYVSNKGNDTNDGKTPETAWATLDKVNSAAASGSIVCFERGGLWRGQLQAKGNNIYTAYGTGDKPKLYASPKDLADPALWQKTDAENIWVYQANNLDIGTLVFNHGENHAIKCVIRTESNGETFNNTTGEPFKTYADLTTDMHFWHDYSGSGKVYLYSDKGNPGERFDSIEANIKQNVIRINGANVTIDNLCIKYTGAHGVGSGTQTNLTVQNCEFGWIGGSIQSEGIYGRNYGTRYGNAVEIYGGCKNFVVTGNYIYQVYDAAITQQLNIADGNTARMDGMTYTKNVIEKSNYSIEYFLRNIDEKNVSGMSDFLIAENLMWWPGVGLSEQRPDKGVATHVKAGVNGEHPCDGYVIRDNLMVGAGDLMFHVATWVEGSAPVLENNDLVAYAGDSFGYIEVTKSPKARRFDISISDYAPIQGTDNRIWFISE